VRGLVASRNDAVANSMRAPQPPPPPPRPGTSLWLFAAIAWFAIGLGLVAANGQRDQSGLTPLFGLIVAVGVPVAYFIYQLNGTHRRNLSQRLKLEDHQAELEEYGRALEIWDQLEFCHRCNSIFLPGNEWQFELNQSGEPIGPHNAWWYSTQLAWHRRSKQRAVVIVPGQGRLPSG
jgi:hypothetical protein